MLVVKSYIMKGNKNIKFRIPGNHSSNYVSIAYLFIKGYWLLGLSIIQARGRPFTPGQLQTQHRIVWLGMCRYCLKLDAAPWLVWLSGLSTGLQARGSLVDSQSGHMPGLWARSPSPGALRGNHTSMFLSLSSSLPLSKNKTKSLKDKIKLDNKKKRKRKRNLHLQSHCLRLSSFFLVNSNNYCFMNLDILMQFEFPLVVMGIGAMWPLFSCSQQQILKYL